MIKFSISLAIREVQISHSDIPPPLYWNDYGKNLTLQVLELMEQLKLTGWF